ncbi:MAG: hypothetical protein NPMRTHETA2_1260014 [Nitrosopumilales archaeon]|nr:MAG: hypothetical protein NPMRTHETA2_1260014 [Nitrosopumilales archaeon]
MPGRIIGTARAIPLAEKAQSILKINGNYSFFALPTDVLEKYGIDSFDIVQNQNKIMLVAHSDAEQLNESYKPPTSKEVVSTI